MKYYNYLDNNPFDVLDRCSDEEAALYVEEMLVDPERVSSWMATHAAVADFRATHYPKSLAGGGKPSVLPVEKIVAIAERGVILPMLTGTVTRSDLETLLSSMDDLAVLATSADRSGWLASREPWLLADEESTKGDDAGEGESPEEDSKVTPISSPPSAPPQQPAGRVAAGSAGSMAAGTGGAYFVAHGVGRDASESARSVTRFPRRIQDGFVEKVAEREGGTWLEVALRGVVADAVQVCAVPAGRFARAAEDLVESGFPASLASPDEAATLVERFWWWLDRSARVVELERTGPDYERRWAAPWDSVSEVPAGALDAILIYLVEVSG